MSHFVIRCRSCGKGLENVYCAFCEHCKGALLTSEYKERNFRSDCGKGIWKFNWLPVHAASFDQPCPLVYKSKGLSGVLGLEDLYIAFNGYWPERGVYFQTCTFKELEAAVVFQNARENEVTSLVVASAGNTARAFSHLSAMHNFPVAIVVPSMCLFDTWYLEATYPVPTIAVGDGDYADSIDVARRISQTLGIPFEGGVKNIAKRDGLGVVLLEACSEIGKLPDHYFQAVGSGTGAIGVWEMAERFIKDGRFGHKLPLLHLAQNAPFVPMVRAWQQDSRELFPEDLRPELIEKITTRVLSTRYPAYSVNGGVYDALKAAGGKMYAVENRETYAAMDLFEKTEGIDVSAAAGVAVAALKEAVTREAVSRDETILLNITGAGERRLRKDIRTYKVSPRFVSKKISEKEISELLCSALKKSS